MRKETCRKNFNSYAFLSMLQVQNLLKLWGEMLLQPRPAPQMMAAMITMELSHLSDEVPTKLKTKTFTEEVGYLLQVLLVTGFCVSAS